MSDIPKKIGKYHIEGVLGKGAMGVVYKALDEKIGRQVAIKTIHAHLLGEDKSDEMLKRFNVEIQAVGKLSHPNIVGIYDTDEFQPDETSDIKVPYFTMEFVEGCELASMLEKGQRFTTTQIVHIIAQVLDGFDYTHQRGIIHRDIKPANIFINDRSDAKIADFGIARFEDSSLTKTGSIIGTPNYMSPEQCAGQVLDLRTDLFSIAVMLYEMLTGEKPFQGNTAHAIMLRITTSMPEKPSGLNPSLPKLFDRLMAKALAKEPKARFQTAAEFRDALLKVHDMTKDDFPGWQPPVEKNRVTAAPDSKASVETVMAPTELDKTLVSPSNDVDLDKTVLQQKPVQDATVLMTAARQIDFVEGKPKAAKKKKKPSKKKLDKQDHNDLNEMLGSEDETIAFYGDVGASRHAVSRNKNRTAMYLTALMVLCVVVAGGFAVFEFSISPKTPVETLIVEKNETYVPDLQVLIGDKKSVLEPGKPLTEKKKAKLNKLLKVAELNMNSGRYIWPSTSNAAYVYRLALQLKSNDETAINGLIKVCDVLVKQAGQLLREKDYDSLKAHLDAALAIFPGEQRLEAYQGKLASLAQQ
ncbi:MAG: serine/threonine protein kinase [Pseudomonadales bacterium]|nr:serine/threonine protein kinase [Pseudomonadales bacterium]